MWLWRLVRRIHPSRRGRRRVGPPSNVATTRPAALRERSTPPNLPAPRCRRSVRPRLRDLPHDHVCLFGEMSGLLSNLCRVLLPLGRCRAPAGHRRRYVRAREVLLASKGFSPCLTMGTGSFCRRWRLVGDRPARVLVALRRRCITHTSGPRCWRRWRPAAAAAASARKKYRRTSSKMFGTGAFSPCVHVSAWG